MRKKIAIITLHNVSNYGSVLQAYATQCFFENMGLAPIIIDYRRPWETTFGYWLYLNDRSLVGIFRNVMYFPSKIVQFFKFNKFRKQYLNLTNRKYKSCKELQTYPVDSNIFCTGSDQVWNSGWNQGVIKEYFLDFVDENVKKIAFAASFGSSNISEKDKEIMKPLLEKYDVITVREEPTVNMLKNEFGIECFEILDPTLQMERNFWEQICENDRYIDEKYVLLIQLNRNHEFDNLSVQFASEKKMKLVRLCLRVDQVLLPGESVVIPEVKDYIRLIRDAEYVLTDSFHAVSFCLNLEKQFFVYYPEKYSERLKSILKITRLMNREIKENVNCGCVTSTIEYTFIRKILEEERKKCKTIFKKYIGN